MIKVTGRQEEEEEEEEEEDVRVYGITLKKRGKGRILKVEKGSTISHSGKLALRESMELT